ncbi:hypothetical protein CY34DRAFT_814582 [Suillus luteus UH-Slu-Lm8-n1]|uniref:Uncharacterized protein n=1 Tax=Suillus luteus UH-Slu-Lm8-n1 TaxID=930992 RepID=A0A0D0AB69_9AGAM|nr:hypothetical protein CY34DRAFT_814582 [Suillus luteus UH-Slu-Lm8-n1]
MHFSSVFIVAALASLISAIPVDGAGAQAGAQAGKCPVMCWDDGACQDCTYPNCWFFFCLGSHG